MDKSPYSPAGAPLLPQPKGSGLAVASLVLGLLSILGSCLTGIPAIICGHLALSRIKKSAGQVGGFGLALTGLILGYLFTAFVIIYAGLAVPVVMKSLKKAEQVTNINNARSLKTALDLYASGNSGAYPSSITDLVPVSFASPAVLNESLTLQKKGKFQYVSGLTQGSPSHLIILFSPVLDSDKRIVVRIDSSCRTLDNATAERELAAQGAMRP